MGRYEQKQENKLINPMAFAVFILVLAIIAAGWFYITEKLGGILEKPEITALPLPQATEEAGYPSSGSGKELLSQTEIPGTEQETAESAAATEPLETIALPQLDNSDDFIGGELLKLSPGLSPWLNTDQLIRKLMRIVNDFAQGSRLEKHMRFFKLARPFVVEEDKEGLFMAPESYRRYDPLSAAINAIDVDAGLALYKKIRPLLHEVYTEFSYPENHGLEDIFKQAASEILAAPVNEQRLALIRPSVFYKYADPKLEGLNPVHKQMLRMGPENTRIIQNKVRKLVEGMVNLEE